jgi:protein-disulfide isomerase
MARLHVPVSAGDHIQGDPEAPVVLVEYGDYECPHCGRAFPIVQRVQRHFGERLGFVFRNFPLNEAHPHAEMAAEAAEFAAANDRFWEMHDGIYENQQLLGEQMLLELSEAIGLSPPDLQKALIARAYAHRVREDFMGGVRSGVNGTPTFYINGQRHDGPFELEFLVAAIEAQLSLV